MDDELKNLVEALDDQTFNAVVQPQFATPIDNGVPGFELTTKFIEATKKVEYTIDVVIDTDNPNVGFAIYNPENSVITVYVHDGFNPTTMLDDRVQKYLQKNKYSMPVSSVIQADINPTELRTCKFFTASRDSFDGDIPVSISNHHDFDKPFAVASCSNEAKLKDIPGYDCLNQQQQCNCNYYQAEKWSVDKHLHSDALNTDWILESHRKGIGFKNFRITKQIGDEKSILWSQDVLNDPEAEINVNKHLTADVDGIVDIVELPVDKSEEVTTRYYDYAFNGK